MITTEAESQANNSCTIRFAVWAKHGKLSLRVIISDIHYKG